MFGYIGITDRNWIEFNKSKNHDNVIFWTRKTKQNPVKNLEGSLFFFLVKGNIPRLIEGYGIVKEVGRETVQTLWNLYGKICGEETLDTLENSLGLDKNEKIAYYLLKDVKYIEDGIDLENLNIKFSPQTQSGRKVNEEETRKLLEVFGDENKIKMPCKVKSELKTVYSKVKRQNRLLSLKEIEELISLIRRDFKHKIELRKESKLAEKIKFPSIPSNLTESLAIHLLRNHNILPELNGFKIDFGGRISDILATNGDLQKMIEVKATGKSAFEYFGDKDIKADYIIWLHFGDFFMSEYNKAIEIYIISEPKKYFDKSQKITIGQLKQIVKDNLKVIKFNMNSL